MKPFLKWVGGKSKLLDEITDTLPPVINDYHEIFLGGGSVLFHILDVYNQNKIKISGDIYAYDINKDLIFLYQTIQSNFDVFYEKIKDLISEYNALESIHLKEKMYYKRTLYNTVECGIDKSVLFLFLNKTGFRGLYRENSKGEFNVPFGNYKKVSIFDYKLFLDISKKIQNVVFKAQDCFDVLSKSFNKDDLVYMDPPYYPINETSFSKYCKYDFGIENNINLTKHVKTLYNQCYIIFHNSYCAYNLKEYQEYNIKEVIVTRQIHSKNPSSKAQEIVVYNTTII